jgi:hypothetical protein
MKCIWLGALAALLVVPALGGERAAPAWQGFAGNAGHTAQATAAAQSLAKLHWKASLDLHPVLTGGELGIHYGSPMITAANTIIFPVKQTATGAFKLQALDATTGAALWSLATTYIVPPHNWTPEYPAHLTAQNQVVFAEAGGVVGVRGNPDSTTATQRRFYFYGKAAFDADPAAYSSHVYIDTPIASDGAGNLYFGFVVTGSTPAGLQSGIARISSTGTGSWVSASAAAGDSTMTEVAMNCVPALSNDHSTIYVTVSNGIKGYLVGLDATTLATKYKVALVDPNTGDPAQLLDFSSAAPTVGPDGDVYYGVLEDPCCDTHNDRGWLLHFNATLSTEKTPGSFGWDSTVSVLPASAVPSYTGKSTYLLMSKYNNYYGYGTGDGHNRIAILDPKATQKDEYSNVTVMKEVISQLAPTQYPGEPQGATYEWCIDTAVTVPASKEVIANSEDGHVYIWNLANNTLSQSLFLNSPRAEAYTPTVVGPDGTIYAINNSTLYAIGN